MGWGGNGTGRGLRGKARGLQGGKEGKKHQKNALRQGMGGKYCEIALIWTKGSCLCARQGEQGLKKGTG